MDAQLGARKEDFIKFTKERVERTLTELLSVIKEFVDEDRSIEKSVKLQESLNGYIATKTVLDQIEKDPNFNFVDVMAMAMANYVRERMKCD